jgi:hypothetical protein
MPPLLAAMSARLRFWLPLPHDMEHASQEAHVPTLQSIGHE